MMLEWDSKDVEMMKQENENKIEVNESIGFKIGKYAVATSPVYIPFILIYIISGFDLGLSILGTLTFDIILMVAVMVYAYRTGMVADALLKRK